MGLGAGACSSPVEVQGSPRPTVAAPDETTHIAPTPAPTPNPSATPTPEPVTLAPGERLWVLDADGRLVTMAPDGSDVIQLTPDSATIVDRQAVWSPDSDRLAWVRIDTTTGDASLVSSRADRSGQWATGLGSAPFYLQWDRSSRRLAAVGAADGANLLSVADIGSEDPPVTVDRGAPYFLSWGPNGDELLVHAGGFRLDRVRVDGTTTIVEELPGDFQTPVWTDDERALLFADEVDGEHFLVASGREGQGRLPLVRYDGYLQFVLNAPTNRIALQVLPESPFPIPDVVTVGLPASPTQGTTFDTVDEVAQEQLVVIATFGGEALVVSETPALAFYWSPDGSVLAWLEELDRGDAQRWMRWTFWNNAAVWSSPEFIPSATFVEDYLPIFDQYAQSLTFFSPDSTSFVYTGTDEVGDSGVWVLPLDPFGVPELVAQGEMAAWSPAAAGSAIANAH